MDYLYENLGDERFQELCSALLIKESPNVQVFPVGQQDGGRDSIVYSVKNNKKEFIVYQVKYVKNPNEVDIHKWLVNIMKLESPKINRLIQRGAVAYYLLTNVRGTGHLDVGTIDTLNSVLENNILTPSMCWWRDDLSRRLEADPLFKWSFPELLNGQDMLNSVLFNNLSEKKEKRENITNAYLADQYENDNEVKFKQIELQTTLLGIFTDVPIRLKKFNENNNLISSVIYDLVGHHRLSLPRNADEIYASYDEGEPTIGAASFLLSSKVQNNLQRILLEGGPGQGKSTISQYICQVHRIRLMNKVNEISIIPDDIKKTPLRFPIKIDLRDIAEWVEKRNPYTGSINEEQFIKNWDNSLEGFLLTHFHYHSKFSSIDSDDLICILKLSPILIVFDGFDEIANIEARKEVISFINKGLNRLSINAKSIQVLVTSRPAAFSNAIGFSVDTYPHFELSDMNAITTKEYVEKWTASRKLSSKDSSQIKKLVDEKLKLPHLKDLAKSPMQLAILLSLLSTRGESLPNKRTALYDSYIELFFNRESEKSAMILNNRDLIIDIHQYLAWILHSEAQLFKNSGRIEVELLNERLKEYLKKEGHDTDITESLFNVMKERVCALVSRIQGTFEFEVQPLREYFCAKFLYNTSPYSPPGAEKPGTKTERFEAISRDPYWQNVVRFFAGCFDKGELPMLIMKLNELQSNDLFKYTNHPRILTAQLLSDWVFSQYPNLLKDVVSVIINGLNVGGILNQDEKFSNEPISLPVDCGRKEVVDQCFDNLKKFPSTDYAIELILLLKNNPYNTKDKWQEFAIQLHGDKLTKWFRYGYMLQVIHRLDVETIVSIIKRDNAINKEIMQLAINGRADARMFNFPDIKLYVFNEILNFNLQLATEYAVVLNSTLSYLGVVHDPDVYLVLLQSDAKPALFITFVERYRFRRSQGFKLYVEENNSGDIIDNKVYDFSQLLSSIINLDVETWQTNLYPWDNLVENSKHVFNYTWSCRIISIISSGIKNREEKAESYHQLNDDSLSLCKRVRFARLKSGNYKWWTEQIQSSNYIEFHLLIFFVWATPNTIQNIIDVLEDQCLRLSKEQLLKLYDALDKLTTMSQFSLTYQKQIIRLVESRIISDQVKYLISFRFPYDSRRSFIYYYVSENTDSVNQILEIKLEFLVKKYISTEHNERLLLEIKEVYSRTNSYNERLFMHSVRTLYLTKIPYDVAKGIMEDYMSYPRIIASLAEKSCRLHATGSITPVGSIAEANHWFD